MFSPSRRPINFLWLSFFVSLACFYGSAGRASEAECWTHAGLTSDIVVSLAANSDVRFCDLYYYLKATTPDARRSQTLARPGAIYQAADNLTVINALATQEQASSKLDPDFLTWQAEDFITRKRMNVRLTELLESRIAHVNVEVLAQEYYQANPKEFLTPASVSVDHILIKAERRGYSEALREIEKIQNLLSQGRDFRDLAADYSEDQSSEMNRGFLGIIRPGQTYPTFEEAAYGLTYPGEVSDPVFSIFGIHLIRLNELIPAEKIPYDQVAGKLKKKVSEKLRADLREQIFNEQREVLSMELAIPEPELFELFQRAFSAEP